MQIIRNSVNTSAGPSEWFTGAVYVDPVATPSAGSRLSASVAHLAMLEVDEQGNSATWGARVTDEEYAAPSIDS